MGKREQLELLIEHYAGGNKSEFARLLNISPQAISTWLSRNQFDIELVYSKCVNINSEWLLTGKGSMTKENSIIKEPNAIYGSINNPFYELYKEKDHEVNRLNQEIGKLNAKIDYLNKKLHQCNMCSMIDQDAEDEQTAYTG